MRHVYCERFFALATARPADLRCLRQNFVHDFSGSLELIDVEHGQKIQEISKIASISTVMFIGKLLTPTADRACLPASPKTSTSKSEQPLITFG
jgi:hypothetical protein